MHETIQASAIVAGAFISVALTRQVIELRDMINRSCATSPACDRGVLDELSPFDPSFARTRRVCTEFRDEPPLVCLPGSRFVRAAAGADVGAKRKRLHSAGSHRDRAAHGGKPAIDTHRDHRGQRCSAQNGKTFAELKALGNQPDTATQALVELLTYYKANFFNEF